MTTDTNKKWVQLPLIDVAKERRPERGTPDKAIHMARLRIESGTYDWIGAALIAGIMVGDPMSECEQPFSALIRRRRKLGHPVESLADGQRDLVMTGMCKVIRAEPTRLRLTRAGREWAEKVAEYYPVEQAEAGL